MAKEVLKKNQPATSTTTIMENLEKLRNRGACGIRGLDVLKQKKVNLKILLNYILRKLNSENVEGSENGSSSW